MSQCFHSYSELDNISCWFERVPSESNIADGPSRGSPQEAVQLINGQSLGDLNLPDDVLDSLMSAGMYSSLSTLSRHVPLPKHDLIGGEAGRV